jgi:hypothetical protein
LKFSGKKVPWHLEGNLGKIKKPINAFQYRKSPARTVRDFVTDNESAILRKYERDPLKDARDMAS